MKAKKRADRMKKLHNEEMRRRNAEALKQDLERQRLDPTAGAPTWRMKKVKVPNA